LVYWFKFLAYLLAIALVGRRAKRIIVPSRWVKKEVVCRLRVNPRKVKVVYQGVSQKFLKRGKLTSDKKGGRTEETLKKYQVRRPYLLYVGSVYPHKNLDRLIKAVKQVNQSLMANHKPEVSLVVVCGRNVFWRRLETKIKRLGAKKIVHPTGFVSEEDLPVFYQEAEAFVFPSFSEGFGLPGLEAMASGCPLICSKIPVFREVYNQIPFYFDPFKVDDLAQKILRVLGLSETERRKRMLEGIKRAKQFSWEKCARETLKVYQEVGKEIKGT
jgi:glycosyltransferase involved in cell wall biosynthesis